MPEPSTQAVRRRNRPDERNELLREIRDGIAETNELLRAMMAETGRINSEREKKLEEAMTGFGETMSAMVNPRRWFS